MAGAAVSAAAVRVRGLNKQYSHGWLGRVTRVLDSVDLDLEPGASLALIGGNGAGKTTLLELLAGLRTPTAGSVRVFGLDPTSAEARARLGYLPDEPHLLPELPLREHLRAFANFHRPRPSRARCEELLARVGLHERADTRAGEASKGMKQRLGLALALLSAPDLLLLDEPLNGLDTDGREGLLELLRAERSAGRSIIIATHDPERLTGLVDRTLRLDGGRLVQPTPGATEGWKAAA